MTRRFRGPGNTEKLLPCCPRTSGRSPTSATGSSEQSPYLAFIVALHVATALALLWFFRTDWVRIIGAFFRTLKTRKVVTADERLAWLIVVATIPVGLTGLALEHTFRTIFAKPLAAAIFLTLNGVILLAGERYVGGAPQRRGRGSVQAPQHRRPAHEVRTPRALSRAGS